jgi:hypothetical protein
MKSPHLHTVTFYEGKCGGGAYPTKWGVTLGNLTKTEPTNATISDIEANGLADSRFNLTTITFSVPSGEYAYQLHPNTLGRISALDGNPIGGSQGLVTVSVLNVAVYTSDFCIIT